MPSKEEIEEAKRNCKKVLEADPLKGTIDFDYCDVDTLIRGIEQLEAEKQELINYIKRMIYMLESTIDSIDDYYLKQEMKAKLESI